MTAGKSSEKFRARTNCFMDTSRKELVGLRHGPLRISVIMNHFGETVQATVSEIEALGEVVYFDWLNAESRDIFG